jgi:hypothetical protein
VSFCSHYAKGLSRSATSFENIYSVALKRTKGNFKTKKIQGGD